MAIHLRQAWQINSQSTNPLEKTRVSIEKIRKKCFITHITVKLDVVNVYGIYYY